PRRSSTGGASSYALVARGLAAAGTELVEGVFEQLLRLLLRAALLHVGQVRLVGLGLRDRRRVLLVAPGREAGGRRVDHIGDLLVGEVRREIADRLIADGVPVRDRHALGVETPVLLPHRAGADTRAADCAS